MYNKCPYMASQWRMHARCRQRADESGRPRGVLSAGADPILLSHGRSEIPKGITTGLCQASANAAVERTRGAGAAADARGGGARRHRPSARSLPLSARRLRRGLRVRRIRDGAERRRLTGLGFERRSFELRALPSARSRRGAARTLVRRRARAPERRPRDGARRRQTALRQRGFLHLDEPRPTADLTPALS